MKITKDNFKTEVVQSDVPVMLDFWADWCGPCRMLSPIVEELEDEYDGRVKFGKINVDEQPELAQAFGVTSIPMLVIMKNGEAVETSVGYRPKEQIESMILKLL